MKIINQHKIPIIITLIIIIMSLPVLLPSAFAHKLLAVNPENTMKEIANPIPDPSEQSWFTLEEFKVHGQSHWYSFVGKQGEQIIIQALVPDIAHSSNFNPSFDLLIGDEKVTAHVTNKNFIEPFSNTKWIVKAELNATLPSYGTYYIRAHDELNHYSVGDMGKFSLGIGDKESFSFYENLLIPVWILQVNLFFGNLIYVWISLVLLLVLVITFLILLKKKNDDE